MDSLDKIAIAVLAAALFALSVIISVVISEHEINKVLLEAGIAEYKVNPQTGNTELTAIKKEK